jgi:hypothetical protein
VAETTIIYTQPYGQQEYGQQQFNSGDIYEWSLIHKPFAFSLNAIIHYTSILLIA